MKAKVTFHQLIQDTQDVAAMITAQHAYEVRPCEDKRSFDLISDALPFGSAVVYRNPACYRLREVSQSLISRSDPHLRR
jgi:hypothetical protein